MDENKKIKFTWPILQFHYEISLEYSLLRLALASSFLKSNSRSCRLLFLKLLVAIRTLTAWREFDLILEEDPQTKYRYSLNKLINIFVRKKNLKHLKNK